MTSRDFAYWLQGFFEISGESLETISKEQADLIRKRLNMVFVHEIDPSHGGPEEQAKLNFIHNAQIQPMPPHLAPNQERIPGQPIARC